MGKSAIVPDAHRLTQRKNSAASTSIMAATRCPAHMPCTAAGAAHPRSRRRLPGRAHWQNAQTSFAPLVGITSVRPILGIHKASKICAHGGARDSLGIARRLHMSSAIFDQAAPTLPTRSCATRSGESRPWESQRPAQTLQRLLRFPPAFSLTGGYQHALRLGRGAGPESQLRSAGAG